MRCGRRDSGVVRYRLHTDYTLSAAAVWTKSAITETKHQPLRGRVQNLNPL